MADNEDHLDETAAADTIAAHGVASRSELLAQMLSATANIPTPALVDFCAKALAFAADPSGAGADAAPDASGSNKASIAMKASSAAPGQPGMPVVQAVREDLDAVLAGQELPAEAVEKLLTLFEAAVTARVQLEVARIEESHETSLSEEAEGLVEKLDGYLDYAAKEFFTENQVAIESSIKVELYEDFLAGLATLFREHWVDVPEDKLDVVADMADRVAELEEAINDKTNEVLELQDQILAVSATRVFDKVSEGLTETDKEKLRSLSETVEFDGDEDALATRVKTIREAHFKSGAKPAVKPAGSRPAVITENEVVTVEVDGETNDGTLIESTPEVAAYAAAIGNLARRKL